MVEAVQAATAALLDADLTIGEQVREADGVIDTLTDSIEERTLFYLEEQIPREADLRVALAILRIAQELERTGDLMINITKASRHLYPHGLEPRIRGLIDRMREQATVQLQLAMESFSDRDTAKAAALSDMDDVMDDLQKELFRTILSTGQADENAVQLAVQMALVGRFFERTADHAVNIGDRVIYMLGKGS